MTVDARAATREAWEARVAEEIMAHLHKAMANGTTPADAGSYSALHDYADANWYTSHYVVPDPWKWCDCRPNCWTHADTCATHLHQPEWWIDARYESTESGGIEKYDLDNAVSGAVDAILAREASELHAGTRDLKHGERMLISPEIQEHNARHGHTWVVVPETQDKLNALAACLPVSWEFSFNADSGGRELFVPLADDAHVCVAVSPGAIDWQVLRDGWQEDAGTWRDPDPADAAIKLMKLVTSQTRS